MVESFAGYWPIEIDLLLYAEDFDYEPSSSNILVRRLPHWFSQWKKHHQLCDNPDAHGKMRSRNRGRRDYDYRRDCVKFAHKVAALTDAVKDDCDMLIWADADTITHERVSSEWLAELFPSEYSMAWLERNGTYPECGFMMFRPKLQAISDFMSLLETTYSSGLVFSFDETHDSFVIQQLVKRSMKEGWFPRPYNLSDKRRGGGLYVFHYSRLGERLDHAKGNRKVQGRTPKGQIVGRKESYWQ